MYQPKVMANAAKLERLARLGGRDRLLLIEAALTLAFASAAIRLLPFRRVAAIAGRRPARRRLDPAAAETEAARIRWAVNAWGRRVPWRAVCFQRGLAAHLMLRRRGLASQLHYGAAQDGEEGLSAHVWVTLEGCDVSGGADAPRFVRLATFPADA